jgi:hypothetical protein
MAIDTGLQVGCTDLQATGGVRQIIVTELTNIDTVTTGSAHNYSSLATGSAAARFEFKNESASLTINGTKENGSTSFEIGLSWTIPNIQGSAFEQLKDLQDACMVAVVELNSGKKLVIGISEAFGNLGVDTNTWDRNQTFATLGGFEGGSGAAYSDDNALTVNLTCKQYELPREYTGAITVLSGDVTATLS